MNPSEIIRSNMTEAEKKKLEQIDKELAEIEAISRMTPEQRKILDDYDAEIKRLQEVDLREEALKDYSVFAPKFIKIVDKTGEQVPFKHNDIQKSINAKIKELRAIGKLVRLIILKGRQHGVTTDAQGRMIYNTVTKSNRNALIVAHEAPATAKIFDKSRYMYDNLDPTIKPLQKASNATELVFDRPTGYKGKGKGLNSKISIQTAGDLGIGRGDTVHYAHLSEFAYWKGPEGKEPKKQLAGINSAVPKTIDTEIIIESTANGFNGYKELWDEAVEGKNEWTPLFFPWHANSDYQMPCTDEEYERLLRNIEDTIATEYIKEIKIAHNLTKEQVKWWVWVYKNDNNGDLNVMKQENPASPFDAFISTGTPIFNNSKVNARIEVLRKKYKIEPPKKGHFIFEWDDPDKEDRIKEKSIKFVEDPNGFITIYEPPIGGYPYVLAGDTKGESINSDMFAGTVINNVTGNRAAVLHGQWASSKPYTWQMYCLGHYYNLALIGIEMNFNTGPIEELERLHYPRQYMRKRYDDVSGDYKNAHGWKTDGNTRPLIIDKEVHLINKNTGLFNDITMLNECITFIRKDGRPDAMSGKHDDVLFSDMIANEIRRHQTFEAEVEKEPVHHSFDTDTNEYESECQSPYN